MDGGHCPLSEDLWMESVRVFVSYQWNTDRDLRAFLVPALRNLSNVDVLYDREFIEPSSRIHDKVSEALDDCDCVLVNLRSLDSPEVGGELIRAHERAKQILLIAPEAKNAPIPPHLDFLNGVLRVTYRSHDELGEELKKFFHGKSRRDYEGYDALSLVRNLAKRKTVMPFQDDLIRRIILEARTEIGEVLGTAYAVNVGIEKNFLVRARSIFKNATRVCAVSLDTVSTFWTDERNRALAQMYIGTQPTNTLRLFVFSSPKEANRYRYILQASHNAYGTNGGVFVCSTTSYKSLLRRCGAADDSMSYSRQDFAILEQRAHGKAEPVTIEALLDQSELRFRQIDVRAAGRLNYTSFLELFEELRNLRVGEAYRNAAGQDSLIIKRWNPKCTLDIPTWREELKELFPEDSSSDVQHFIFLRDADGKVEDALTLVKSALRRHRDRLGIKSVWLGRSLERHVGTDALHRARLKITSDYDLVLAVKFETSHDLMSYYADQDHSEIRRRLYRRLDRGVDLISVLTEQIELSQSKKTALFEDVIEELVARHLVRYDFIEREDIDSIVEEPPVHFAFRNAEAD
jgi:hypothetical protein